MAPVRVGHVYHDGALVYGHPPLIHDRIHRLPLRVSCPLAPSPSLAAPVTPQSSPLPARAYKEAALAILCYRLHVSSCQAIFPMLKTILIDFKDNAEGPGLGAIGQSAFIPCIYLLSS